MVKKRKVASNADQDKFEDVEERLVKRRRHQEREDSNDHQMRNHQKEKSGQETKKVDKRKRRKSKISKYDEVKHDRNKKKRHRKESNRVKSRRSAKDKETRKNSIHDMEDLSQSFEADDWKSPINENRKQCRSRNRRSDRQDRLEKRHCDRENEQNHDENSLEISLMSRRMMAMPKKTLKKKSKPARNINHGEDSYKKFKKKAESVMDEKLSEVAMAIKNCTERICESSCHPACDDRKQVIGNIRKVIEKENSESLALFKQKTCINQTLAKRCRVLEKQLASAENRCKHLAKDARLCQKARRDHKALEGELKAVCEHNTALQKELSEVKITFKEQIAEKVSELESLNEIRNSLTIKAKEFREEMEKSLDTQRAKHTMELSKIREDHAKEISRLQVQCSDLIISNIDLKVRNKDLKKVLMDNKIDPPAFVKTVVTTPGRGAASDLSDQAAFGVRNEAKNTPYSGQRKEFFKLHSSKNSSTEISMLKADIASLRVSLESKSTQISELWKIYHIYKLLTGLRITKSELFFECFAKNPESKVEFLFSLICQDSGGSILYEKNSWDAERECPGFLNDCSGQFFDCKMAPLFLKNVIKEVFAPVKPL